MWKVTAVWKTRWSKEKFNIDRIILAAWSLKICGSSLWCLTNLKCIPNLTYKNIMFPGEVSVTF